MASRLDDVVESGRARFEGKPFRDAVRSSVREHCSSEAIEGYFFTLKKKG